MRFYYLNKKNLKKKIKNNNYNRVSTKQIFFEKIKDNNFIKIDDGNIKNHEFYLDNFFNYSRINQFNVIKIDKYNIWYFKNKNYYNSKECFLFKVNRNHKFIKKINVKAVIMPHWGWTDIIISVSLINYYNFQFKNLKIIGLYHQKKLLTSLFPKNKIYFINNPDGGDLDTIVNKLKDDHFFLNYGHQSSQCLSFSLNRIKSSIIFKIKLFFLSSHIIKLNLSNLKYSCSNEIDKIKNLDKHSNYFDERIYFYESAYLNKKLIFKFFEFNRNKKNEDKLFKNKVNKMNTTKFTLIHTTNNLQKFKEDEINLIRITENIIDSLSLIENAKKIIFYDSVYGMLIYLGFFSGFLKLKGKLYFNIKERSKIIKFFDLNKIKSNKRWKIIN